MRFASIPPEILFVLMMVIVSVHVCVFERFVLVLMIVVLTDMKPDTESHEPTRYPEADPGCFAHQQ